MSAPADERSVPLGPRRVPTPVEPPGNEQLTLIIPTVGRAGPLATLLDDLAAQDPPLAEILVVDAMFQTACRDLCRQWQEERPEVPLRHLEAPADQRGLPASRNYAVQHARTPFVAFLDDDIRVGPSYCRRLLEPFADPDVHGVGGYICNEVDWQPDQPAPTGDLPHLSRDGWYYLDGWRRRLPKRWRWRLRLGLARVERPGTWSAASHVWPLGFWPPGDDWQDVDFVMGGASAWRRSLFREIRFPGELPGYGHYEDLIFSLQASRRHRLVLHRGARLEHHHHPQGRPSYRRYGYQVSYHGYSLWRQFRRRGGLGLELEFWATELFNALARLPSRGGFAEAFGRLEGAIAALRRPFTVAVGPALETRAADQDRVRTAR